MTFYYLATLSVVGLISGILSGMLGIGGAVIVIPALLEMFMAMGINTNTSAHVAFGTSLSVMTVTFLRAAFIQYRKNKINFYSVYNLLPSALLGSFFVALFSYVLPGKLLEIMFAIYLLYISFSMAIKTHDETKSIAPSKIKYLLTGFIIGGVSSALGIGGGTMSVPFFHKCGLSLSKAVASSTVLGFCMAFVGTIGYAISGIYSSNLPTSTIGYIYFPATIVISALSLFSVNFGVYISHATSDKLLKYTFSFVFMIISFRLIFIIIAQNMNNY